MWSNTLLVHKWTTLSYFFTQKLFHTNKCTNRDLWLFSSGSGSWFLSDKFISALNAWQYSSILEIRESFQPWILYLSKISITMPSGAHTSLSCDTMNHKWTIGCRKTYTEVISFAGTVHTSEHKNIHCQPTRWSLDVHGSTTNLAISVCDSDSSWCRIRIPDSSLWPYPNPKIQIRRHFTNFYFTLQTQTKASYISKNRFKYNFNFS